MKSISILNKITLLLMGWYCCCTPACKKDESPRTPAITSIVQYIRNTPELNMLKTAVERAHADTLFDKGGPYTFFAPTDSAFLKAGWTIDKINAYDPSALSLILRYNIAQGRINSTELFGFFTEDLLVLHPTYRPSITKNYHGIYFNGAKVIKADIVAGEGVIHELDRLILPPVGNILEAIEAQPDLTYMSSFFNRMITARDLILNNQVTILAPTDSAWKVYGIASPEDFSKRDTSFLYDNFIRFCIQAGPHFSSEFLDGFNLFGFSSPFGNPFDHIILIAETDNGLLGVYPGSSGQVGNLTPPALIRTDITGANGVLHVLDQVFLNPY